MTTVFTADALKDQVVFITGASRGIGAGILDACLAAGATVIGTATSESGAAAITQKIAEANGKGEGVVLNVTDAEQSEKVLGDVSAKYGAVTVFLTMLNMAILISANLGVMNLLPLPALDGGRLLFLIIEAIRGKAVPREMEAMVHTVGLLLLLALMVFVMYQDITKIFL